MDRRTYTYKTQHVFSFTQKELAYFGLESERQEYMEHEARKSLEKDGYAWTSDYVFFDMADTNSPISLLTIIT